MDEQSYAKLKVIWNQREIPVILRRDDGSLRIRKLPYSPLDAAWLRRLGRSNPTYDTTNGFWEAPKAWFNRLVKQFVDEVGHVYLIQPFKEQQICAPACQSATRHECECSCMGANHGANNDMNDWFIVSNAFASRWENAGVACRLLKRGT